MRVLTALFAGFSMSLLGISHSIIASPSFKLEREATAMPSNRETNPKPNPVIAQQSPAPPSTPGSPPAVDPNAPVKPKLPEKVIYSEAEKKAECRKFEGQFIAYYDRVFKVEKCQRREVALEEDGNHPALKATRIIQVENKTVAMIPEGPSLDEKNGKPKKPNCAKLEGRYIISKASDIFFVESCKKRPFPDWDTYADHAEKRNKRGVEVLELSESEFEGISLGKDIPSTLTDEYKKLLVTEKNIDIIPIDEACRGLNGSYVSYYAKIYKIQSCHKHEVDAEKFLLRYPSYKLKELSSEQWVSMPTGKALKL